MDEENIHVNNEREDEKLEGDPQDKPEQDDAVVENDEEFETDESENGSIHITIGDLNNVSSSQDVEEEMNCAENERTLEEKPWCKPGADITDFFNYGFDEKSWTIYCDRQRKLRALTGVDNKGNSYSSALKSETKVLNENQPREHGNSSSKRSNREPCSLSYNVNTSHRINMFANNAAPQNNRFLHPSMMPSPLFLPPMFPGDFSAMRPPMMPIPPPNNQWMPSNAYHPSHSRAIPFDDHNRPWECSEDFDRDYDRGHRRSYDEAFSSRAGGDHTSNKHERSSDRNRDRDKRHSTRQHEEDSSRKRERHQDTDKNREKERHKNREKDRAKERSSASQQTSKDRSRKNDPTKQSTSGTKNCDLHKTTKSSTKSSSSSSSKNHESRSKKSSKD